MTSTIRCIFTPDITILKSLKAKIITLLLVLLVLGFTSIKPALSLGFNGLKNDTTKSEGIVETSSETDQEDDFETNFHLHHQQDLGYSNLELQRLLAFQTHKSFINSVPTSPPNC